MSPPQILSSPFLNLNTINTILSSPAPIPIEQRIQLLEAKIHLLTSSLPNLFKPPTSISKEAPSITRDVTTRDQLMVEISKIRLDLGTSYLDQKVPNYIKAEMELGIVDRNCRNLLKRIQRKKEPSSMHERSKDTLADSKDSTASYQGDDPWIEELMKLRIDALKQMIRVEEGLGRDGRADRWRKTIAELQSR